MISTTSAAPLPTLSSSSTFSCCCKGTMNGAALGHSHSLSLWKGTTALYSHHFPSPVCIRNFPKISAVSLEDIPPNAFRRKHDADWWGGFSLGVDLGMSRTGLALSKGFSFRPLTVLQLRGQKLELRLLEIAKREEVDEFIIGLPKSCDGKETDQSNKVRSIAGRFAALAAERGWRVYLLDEHGTSTEAMSFMIDQGVSKSARHGRIDAYAAVMVLERYFALSGQGIELVLPKQLDLQEKLRIGPPRDVDF